MYIVWSWSMDNYTLAWYSGHIISSSDIVHLLVSMAHYTRYAAFLFWHHISQCSLTWCSVHNFFLLCCCTLSVCLHGCRLCKIIAVWPLWGHSGFSSAMRNSLVFHTNRSPWGLPDLLSHMMDIVNYYVYITTCHQWTTWTHTLTIIITADYFCCWRHGFDTAVLK